MQSKGRDKLIEKYLEAESNLNEEQEIFNAESTNSELGSVVEFCKKTRVKAPENLNHSVWEGIQNKTKNKQTNYLWIGSYCSFNRTNNHTFSKQFKKTKLRGERGFIKRSTFDV